jgi:hypothetical protein
MISSALRRATAAAASVVPACLLAATTAATVSAHGARQPSHVPMQAQGRRVGSFVILDGDLMVRADRPLPAACGG